jgi:hypothetical protein
MECYIQSQKSLEFIDILEYKNVYLYYSVLSTCAIMNMCSHGDICTGVASHIRNLLEDFYRKIIPGNKIFLSYGFL